MGALDTLKTLEPDMAENRYWVADTAINTFDVDTSSQVVSAILSQHPEIEYWLVFAEVDDMAKGAAAALDSIGLTDNSCVMTFGGTGLQIQWDAGVQDAWRAACYLPQTSLTRPSSALCMPL
jgi:ABC-type sugar transport system substrate-binding protein